MLALVFALLLGAQTVTTDELQRVQDTVNEVSDDISQLRRGDSALAGQLERQLDQVRDDVAYLRVKQRRNETIDRREYADVRDRLEDIRVRARGETVHGAVLPDDTRAYAARGDVGRRDKGRHRVRRPPAVVADVRHGAGGRPLHGDDGCGYQER